MIDLHAHVLPDLDDGPRTADESLAFLRRAEQDGIHALAAVVHANDARFNVPKDPYCKSFYDLERTLRERGLGIRLMTAMEVRIGPGLVEGFLEGRFLPLADTRCACIELPTNDFPIDTMDNIQRLQKAGFRVALMHPETNRSLRRHPDLVERIMALGAVGIASAGSVLGQMGPEVERLSMDLMEAGLVQTVGSGTHSSDRRPVRLSAVRELLYRRFGEREVHWMMEDVPRMLLSDQPIELRPRQPLGWQRWVAGRR